MRDAMLAVLGAQQDKRNDYDGLSWIDAELDVMHRAVNVERENRHLPAVELAVVKAVERYASGSTDYSSKFALYCAELALGVSPNHKETK